MNRGTPGFRKPPYGENGWRNRWKNMENMDGIDGTIYGEHGERWGNIYENG